MGKTVRMSISLPMEIHDKLEKFAVEKGLSKSNVVSLAVSAGFKAIAIAADPTWQKYFEVILKEENGTKRKK
jgi:hypothetical protein